jgi:hypothetical protein
LGRTGLARRESRCSLTRAPRIMPSERVRNTFVERNDLAKYVGHRPLAEDSRYDRRRSEPFAALLPNPEGASVALVRWVKWLPRPRVLRGDWWPSAGGRVGSDAAVPPARQWSVSGLSDTGKAHPAEQARWVGSPLRCGSPHRRSIAVVLAKAGRANTSATQPGSSQRELRGPSEGESTLRSIMPLTSLQARWWGR